MKIQSFLSFAIVALVAPAFGSTPFAGEDFDGNLGQTGPLTAVFTPDNSMSGTSFPAGFAGGSFFDRYGILARGPDTPFDMMDDSLDMGAPVFENDVWGILHDDKTDNVVALADTVNSNNPDPNGAVQAVWTFDISDRDSIEISIDMAMQGVFEGNDTFDFTYSIDGAPSQAAFLVTGDTTTPSVPYSHTDQSGTFHDRYDNIFWSEQDWLDLTDPGIGPGDGINFHEDDLDQDGFITVNFLSETIQVKALEETNNFGTFQDQEVYAFERPLYVNGNSITGTQLTTDFQTLTADIDGTGSTLTLTFDGVADGGFEYFMFDNIVLSEADAPVLDAGDFNGDGQVDNTDLNLLLGSWGESTVPAEWVNGFEAPVENGELNALLADWGNGTGGAAVPEPVSAVLAAIAAVGFAARRR